MEEMEKQLDIMADELKQVEGKMVRQQIRKPDTSKIDLSSCVFFLLSVEKGASRPQ